MTVARSVVVASVVVLGVGGSAGVVAEAGAQGARPKLVAPVRGEAEVQITKPATKIVGSEVVTTILLKNMETEPIAGLRVNENWYDAKGTPVGGDIFRQRRPIQPGDVIKIELRSPRPPKGSRNQYSFTHANGTIKQKVVPKLEEPKPKPTTN